MISLTTKSLTVRVRVMIGFLVGGRLMIKIRIRVSVRVGFMFIVSVYHYLEQLLQERMLYMYSVYSLSFDSNLIHSLNLERFVLVSFQ